MDDYFEEKGIQKEETCGRNQVHSHTAGNRAAWQVDLLTGKEVLVHRDRILDRGAFYLNLPLWRAKRLPIKASPSILKYYLHGEDCFNEKY